MINLIDTKVGYVTLIVIHLFLGVMLKLSPGIVALAYPLMFLLFMTDVLYNLDRGSRAGFYALHMIGYEMVYRMAGATYSWEMGKYASIILLLFGLFVGGENIFPGFLCFYWFCYFLPFFWWNIQIRKG
ncbi:hypothetical protein [Geofilum rubicundum]|uniref:Uncharacterized protein n=1 Tax=Geofilum rubicundum JCM 15548 TaxID=1236989 RepID=A0A0E9LTR7_9BACT|nr:hypothetical protein [Geofilum rubicundum]GAO28521.1 hypothetical protein JCM15548_1627 [Geofilum rubicundum JCM 15548]